MVTNEDEPMEKVVGKLLLAKNKTMCTAESCTGGYIAHLLTSIAGSSEFYDGSVVSYSYEAKEDLLHVNNQTLLTKGAVSEEVVTANGQRRFTKYKIRLCDCCIVVLWGPMAACPKNLLVPFG